MPEYKCFLPQGGDGTCNWSIKVHQILMYTVEPAAQTMLDRPLLLFPTFQKCNIHTPQDCTLEPSLKSLPFQTPKTALSCERTGEQMAPKELHANVSAESKYWSWCVRLINLILGSNSW